MATWAACMRSQGSVQFLGTGARRWGQAVDRSPAVRRCNTCGGRFMTCAWPRAPCWGGRDGEMETLWVLSPSPPLLWAKPGHPLQTNSAHRRKGAAVWKAASPPQANVRREEEGGGLGPNGLCTKNGPIRGSLLFQLWVPVRQCAAFALTCPGTSAHCLRSRDRRCPCARRCRQDRAGRVGQAAATPSGRACVPAGAAAGVAGLLRVPGGRRRGHLPRVRGRRRRGGRAPAAPADRAGAGAPGPAGVAGG